MIEDYQKFKIPDSSGKNDIIAEVNWENGQKCEMIKLTLPDDSKAFVKRDDLSQILFAIGDKETQMALTPQKITTVHHLRTILGIKATKDIKKDEMINFPIEIPFTCDNIKTVSGKEYLNKLSRTRLATKK